MVVSTDRSGIPAKGSSSLASDWRKLPFSSPSPADDFLLTQTLRSLSRTMFPTWSGIRCETLSGAIVFLASDPLEDPLEDPVGMDIPVDLVGGAVEPWEGAPASLRPLADWRCCQPGPWEMRMFGRSLTTPSSGTHVLLVPLPWLSQAARDADSWSPEETLVSCGGGAAERTDEPIMSPMSLASSYFLSCSASTGSSCFVDMRVSGGRPSRLGGRRNGSWVDSSYESSGRAEGWPLSSSDSSTLASPLARPALLRIMAMILFASLMKSSVLMDGFRLVSTAEPTGRAVGGREFLLERAGDRSPSAGDRRSRCSEDLGPGGVGPGRSGWWSEATSAWSVPCRVPLRLPSVEVPIADCICWCDSRTESGAGA